MSPNQLAAKLGTAMIWLRIGNSGSLISIPCRRSAIHVARGDFLQ
jgi:hypothetical protein